MPRKPRPSTKTTQAMSNLSDQLEEPSVTIELPEGYELLATEQFVPLDTDDVVPDNFYAGKVPPDREDLQSLVGTVYWHDLLNHCVRTPPVLTQTGADDPNVDPNHWPTTESIPRFVVDFETTTVTGKIVPHNGVKPLEVDALPLDELKSFMSDELDKL